jgi:replicative DNA helicase
MLSDHPAQRAERTLLGALFRHSAAVAEVVPLVRPEDFYGDANQKIYAAMLALFEQGKPADLPSVADVLQRRGQVEDVGGYGYLAELFEAAGTGPAAASYAGTVREHSVFRRLAHAGRLIADAADRPTGSAEQALEAAEREIFAIAQLGLAGDTVRLSEALGEASERIDARVERGAGLPCGVSTGFADLDDRTAGLQNSELVVVGARTGCGKTALALALARNAAASGTPTLFVSLEQSRAELAERLWCAEGSVDSHRTRRGYLSADEAQRLQAARRRIDDLPLFIDHTPAQTTLRITANARRLRLRHGVGLVIIDYLQLIEPDDRRVSRQQQIGGITRRLKLLARDLAVPVVALCQLNREAEDRRRPELRDLREAGDIEQDSDVVILMHRPKGERQGDTELDPGVRELFIGKQRNGPVGEVRLAFVPQFTRFEDFIPGRPPGGVTEVRTMSNGPAPFTASPPGSAATRGLPTTSEFLGGALSMMDGAE